MATEMTVTKFSARAGNLTHATQNTNIKLRFTWGV